MGRGYPNPGILDVKGNGLVPPLELTSKAEGGDDEKITSPRRRMRISRRG